MEPEVGIVVVVIIRMREMEGGRQSLRETARVRCHVDVDVMLSGAHCHIIITRWERTRERGGHVAVAVRTRKRVRVHHLLFS